MDSPKRISLVTLMGLPGSGKTTLCEQLTKLVSTQIPKPETPVPAIQLLQYDALVPFQIQSKFSQQPGLAKTLRNNFIEMVTRYVQILKEENSEDSLSQLAETELLDTETEELFPKNAFITAFIAQVTGSSNACSQKDVILLIDDNNYYKSMRNDFYQIAKSNCLGFCVLYPIASLSVCEERNLQRNEKLRLPSCVIQEMAKKMEEPNPMQNPSDALCLRIADVLDPTTYNLVYDTLIYTLQNPIKPNLSNVEDIARDRRICAESEIHQADLILRKWIHTELALASFGSKRQELRSRSQKFQEKKRQVLDGLRSGDIKVISVPGDEYEFRKEILCLARQVKLDK